MGIECRVRSLGMCLILICCVSAAVGGQGGICAFPAQVFLEFNASQAWQPRLSAIPNPLPCRSFGSWRCERKKGFPFDILSGKWGNPAEAASTSLLIAGACCGQRISRL